MFEGGRQIAGERRPLGALEAIADNDRIVILGGPGSGKSTLLGHLTFCLAQHQLEPQGEWLSQLEGWPAEESAALPIVVVLRDFARSIGTRPVLDATQPRLLLEFIGSRLEAQNLGGVAPALERALDQGRALVLLDGLDEIPTRGARAAVRAAVRAFCARYDRSRFIVTCRTLSYQDPAAQLGEFAAYELAPFDPPRIAAFIGAWYAELLRLGQVDAARPRAARTGGSTRGAACSTLVGPIAPRPESGR